MADSMKTSEEEEEVRPGISNTGAEVEKRVSVHST